MPNVYLDPNSYVYLDNVLFEKSARFNTNNCREPFIFLKEYCAQRGINLQTIDFWRLESSRQDDVYVSFDHKFFLRRRYWKRRNRRYRSVNLDKFSKRILFQFEPPVVMPEIRYLTNRIMRIYDKTFFTWEIDNPQAQYFHTAQAHSSVFPEYWQNTNRKFLTLINSNRSSLSRYKELFTERVRAILFFGKTNEIDLYGFGWEKRPLFPYWFEKNNVQKTYKGAIQNKYETLNNYTFAFAFENCALPGYITDKVFDCLFVGTIPIYLGAPGIKEYIPKNCFIDMRDFNNYGELRKFLKALSQSEIQGYKENGRRFLESENYKPFTKEHFAEVFAKAIIER